MKSLGLSSLALATLILASGRSDADLVYDDFSNVNYSYKGNLNEAAGVAAIPEVYVGKNTTISRIGVQDDLNTAGDLKFVIFDDATRTLLYSSPSQAFAADASGVSTWKVSPVFSFTLLIGHFYGIGAVPDVATTQPYFEADSITQNGITAFGNIDGTVSGFASPTYTHDTGNVSIPLQLYSPSAVPEPSSLALCAVAGALGLAVARTRRKRPA